MSVDHGGDSLMFDPGGGDGGYDMLVASGAPTAEAIVMLSDHLHLRRCRAAMDLARRFISEVQLEVLDTGRKANVKSPFELAGLLALRRARVRIRAAGVDAENAVGYLAAALSMDNAALARRYREPVWYVRLQRADRSPIRIKFGNDASFSVDGLAPTSAHALGVHEDWILGAGHFDRALSAHIAAKGRVPLLADRPLDGSPVAMPIGEVALFANGDGIRIAGELQPGPYEDAFRNFYRPGSLKVGLGWLGPNGAPQRDQEAAVINVATQGFRLAQMAATPRIRPG